MIDTVMVYDNKASSKILKTWHFGIYILHESCNKSKRQLLAGATLPKELVSHVQRDPKFVSARRRAVRSLEVTKVGREGATLDRYGRGGARATYFRARTTASLQRSNPRPVARRGVAAVLHSDA